MHLRTLSLPRHATQVFVDVEGTAAGPGLLALSASAVAFGYLYLRRRYTIDPAGEGPAAAAELQWALGHVPGCW